jgi:hypothetical protein
MFSLLGRVLAQFGGGIIREARELSKGGGRWLQIGTDKWNTGRDCTVDEIFSPFESWRDDLDMVLL